MASMTSNRLTKTARYLARHAGLSLPPLLLLSDPDKYPDPVPLVTRLPAGSGVVFRHYALAPTRRAALGQTLRILTHERNLFLLVANDPVLARHLNADGLHLPEYQLQTLAGWQAARAMRMRGKIVTAACHTASALVRASRIGVHAALFSPVFPTTSHPQTRPSGLLRFARLTRQAPLPVYALGGITAGNAARLQQSGAAGLAGASGVCV